MRSKDRRRRNCGAERNGQDAATQESSAWEITATRHGVEILHHQRPVMVFDGRWVQVERNEMVPIAVMMLAAERSGVAWQSGTRR